MYKNQLEFKLKSADFPRCFMLYGAEDYQIEHYAKEILAKFNTPALELFFDEYDFSTAKTHLEQDSLFGDLNVLHIKTDKKIPLKELKILFSLAQNSQNAFFMYELHDGVQKNVLEQVKVFDENFVRFFQPSNDKEAIDLLIKHSQKLHLQIQNIDALKEIYKIHNHNIYLSTAELNRLAASGINVNTKNVNALVSPLSSISFEELFNELIQCKDVKEKIVNFIKHSNLEIPQIINAFYSAFYRLFVLNTAWRTNPNTPIKDILNYEPPKQVIDTLKEQARQFSTLMFLDIFIHLNYSDYELKRAKNFMDKELYLIYSLLELQNIIEKHRKN